MKITVFSDAYCNKCNTMHRTEIQPSAERNDPYSVTTVAVVPENWYWVTVKQFVAGKVKEQNYLLCEKCGLQLELSK